MGNSRYVGEPTIGKSVPQVPPRRTTGDANRGPEGQPTPDRSVAQPLPGKEVEPVKERTGASQTDKADALTKHSKTGKSYEEEDVLDDDSASGNDGESNQSEEVSPGPLEAAPIDIDPPAANPSDSLDAAPEAQEDDLEVSGEAAVDDLEIDEPTELSDEDLDGLDPLEN